MSSSAVQSSDGVNKANIAAIDMKIEVSILPVSDIERAKDFYVKKLGWRVDVTPPGVVQLTPHGSPCSVQFGGNLTSAAPGSAKGYIVVSDLQSTRQALIDAGVVVGEIFHLGAHGFENGPDPEHRTYRSRALFGDPDGNTWILQEITTRLAGRVDSGITSYGSVTDLVTALRRAAAAHGEHEKRIGQADPNWPEWYASYMAAEQTGAELPK